MCPPPNLITNNSMFYLKLYWHAVYLVFTFEYSGIKYLTVYQQQFLSSINNNYHVSVLNSKHFLFNSQQGNQL